MYSSVPFFDYLGVSSLLYPTIRFSANVISVTHTNRSSDLSNPATNLNDTTSSGSFPGSRVIIAFVRLSGLVN